MDRAVSGFFRLTIAKKLLFGFLSIGILIILIAFVTLSSLQRLNEINRRVIERDVRLIEITDKMIETLLAQELYGRRSFILKSSEMEALFWKRSEEFRLSIGGLLLGLTIALTITRNISRSVHQLKLSTREISKGKFDHLPEVRNQDELGELSQAIQRMAQRLKSLEEMSLDASPLTHLPGGIAIENIVNKRLKQGTPLAFCQLDLSHFKAFNDRYGYARGNEVIQATARMITEVMKTQGDEEDFIGHIGGDDFVAITSPERYEKIDWKGDVDEIYESNLRPSFELP